MARDLVTKDVCAIILTCAEAGVSVLKFGNLHVEFGRAATPAQDYFSHSGPVPVAAITEEDKRTIKESLRREEILLRDDQISLAVIEDPSLAEELITGELHGENGEIEDDAQEG